MKSWTEVNHGDVVTNPIDGNSTVYVDADGEKYLVSERCLFPVWQFDPEDFEKVNE